MPYLSDDFKPAKFAHRIAPLNCFITNKVTQPFLSYGLPKGLQFFFRAFGDQLDPAIRQVTDRACHLKTGGNRLHSITKSDALHATRIKNLHSLALHKTTRANVNVALLSAILEENQPSGDLTVT